jgi:hypothetical protein
MRGLWFAPVVDPGCLRGKGRKAVKVITTGVAGGNDLMNIHRLNFLHFGYIH